MQPPSGTGNAVQQPGHSGPTFSSHSSGRNVQRADVKQLDSTRQRAAKQKIPTPSNQHNTITVSSSSSSSSCSHANVPQKVEPTQAGPAAAKAATEQAPLLPPPPRQHQSITIHDIYQPGARITRSSLKRKAADSIEDGSEDASANRPPPRQRQPRVVCKKYGPGSDYPVRPELLTELRKVCSQFNEIDLGAGATEGPLSGLSGDLRASIKDMPRGIYGELTTSSIASLLQYMVTEWGFGPDSLFLDVGHGRGKAMACASLVARAKWVCGVEIQPVNYTQSVTCLQKVKDLLPSNIGVICKDLLEMPSFAPFEFVYSFCLGKWMYAVCVGMSACLAVGE